jgi:hypothetical protein
VDALSCSTRAISAPVVLSRRTMAPSLPPTAKRRPSG